MKETIRRLYKPFILIFLVSLLIINWHDISFFFNYRFISSQLSNLSEKIKPAQVELSDDDYFAKENSIEILKIGLEAPIISVKDDNEKDFEVALKRGVLLHPISALPGERGTTIILGHSAPVGWPDINYDDVFNRLNELEKGDEIIVHYNHLRYIYKVNKKDIFYPEDEQSFLPENNEKIPFLVLLTCWPSGKDLQRFAIFAELI